MSCHILNHIIQDGLPLIENVLYKIMDSVKYVNNLKSIMISLVGYVEGTDGSLILDI